MEQQAQLRDGMDSPTPFFLHIFSLHLYVLLVCE
jgi:hypothetical protein